MPSRAALVGVILGCLSAALLAPPAAAAAVRVDHKRVVIRARDGATAIITRAPFGIAFVDPHGRVVLREVASRTRPLQVGPISQLEFGTQTVAPATLYAPLAFLVGRQTITQEPGGQWGGDLATVTVRGVEYSARRVLGVVRAGEGVVLSVATDDPSGRRLRVSIAPLMSGDAFSVSVRPSFRHGIAAMLDSFRSDSREAFHGFGGRHNGLDQHGSEFYNWLEQENVSSGTPSGWTAAVNPATDRFLYPNGPTAAYFVQSSFISSAGYGFLLARDELSHWRLDSDRPDAWQVEAAAAGLDYTVVPAGAAQALGRLTALTGRQPLPPTWAMGAILDRAVRYPPESPATYAAEVQDDIDHMTRDHLKISGYRIEAWQALPRRTLRHLIAELKARGIHPLLYFRAFVGLDPTGTDDPAQYRLAVARGYVATHADRRPYIFESNFSAPAALIDFTNPAAVRWWRARISAALNLGADGFMLDFGEQTQTDMHFHDGETGAVMHNRYPALYDRVTRMAVATYEKRHPGRRVFFFTRAGYSGSAGDGRFENANFPGDETTDWTAASGLAAQTPDMLNRAIGGAYGFTTDIGGYFDIGPYQPTSEELFVRWAQWAALSPFFRLHGAVLHGVHMPWSFDRRTLRIYKGLIALHDRALPLISSLWRTADRTGIPITRPLWLADPGDPRAAAQESEWLLGPDVLVAPVVIEGARARSVFFPPGCWRRPGTTARISSPGPRRVPAGLGTLPYYVRCGSHPFSARGRASS